MESYEDQFKYEQWLADHCPNIDTHEHKKRRAQLHASLFKKLDELESIILFLQEQQRKNLVKEKELAELKQSQHKSEKSHRVALETYTKSNQPLQKLTGAQTTELYRLKNIFKEYLDSLNKKRAAIQTVIDAKMHELQIIKTKINTTLPKLGQLWNDFFKNLATLNKDKKTHLRIKGLAIDIPLGPLSENLAALSEKLASGEIPSHDAKNAQQKIIDQYLVDYCGEHYNQCDAEQRHTIVNAIEVEVLKDANKISSFIPLSDALINAVTLEEQQARAMAEKTEAENNMKLNELERSKAEKAFKKASSMMETGKAHSSAEIEQLIKFGSIVESFLKKDSLTEERSETPRPRM